MDTPSICQEESGRTREVPLFRRVEGDWCAEDPRSWYQGPLIFLEETQDGLKEYQTN